MFYLLVSCWDNADMIVLPGKYGFVPMEGVSDMGGCD